MAPTTTTKVGAPKTVKKTKSTGGGGRKKLTPFNKFMQSEMQRLKEEEPDLAHRERFKQATANWKNAPENPKKVA